MKGCKYTQYEDKYNFDGISFPTPMSDIKKFEKNNNNVSINVYGLDKKFQTPKLPTYEVYVVCVVDEEKTNHFDLLLVTDGDNSHYIYIYRIFPDWCDRKKQNILRELFSAKGVLRHLTTKI